MKSVRIKAKNIKSGDVWNGHRVGPQSVFVYPNRKGGQKVLVILKNRSGYRLDTVRFNAEEHLIVKRPKYNMEYAKG